MNTKDKKIKGIVRVSVKKWLILTSHRIQLASNENMLPFTVEILFERLIYTRLPWKAERMRLRAKHGRSEADAPFARTKSSGPEYKAA